MCFKEGYFTVAEVGGGLTYNGAQVISMQRGWEKDAAPVFAS